MFNRKVNIETLTRTTRKWDRLTRFTVSSTNYAEKRTVRSAEWTFLSCEGFREKRPCQLVLTDTCHVRLATATVFALITHTDHIYICMAEHRKCKCHSWKGVCFVITYFIHWSHSSSRLSFALCQFPCQFALWFDYLRVQCRSAVACFHNTNDTSFRWHKDEWIGGKRYKKGQRIVKRVRAWHTSTPGERCFTKYWQIGKWNQIVRPFT